MELQEMFAAVVKNYNRYSADSVINNFINISQYLPREDQSDHYINNVLPLVYKAHHENRLDADQALEFIERIGIHVADRPTFLLSVKLPFIQKCHAKEELSGHNMARSLIHMMRDLQEYPSYAVSPSIKTILSLMDGAVDVMLEKHANAALLAAYGAEALTAQQDKGFRGKDLV